MLFPDPPNLSLCAYVTSELNPSSPEPAQMGHVERRRVYVFLSSPCPPVLSVDSVHCKGVVFNIHRLAFTFSPESLANQSIA